MDKLRLENVLFLSLCAASLFNLACSSGLSKVYVTVLLPNETEQEPSSLLYGSMEVVDLAVEKMRDILPSDVEVVAHQYDTKCKHASLIAGLTHKIEYSAVQVFVGPACNSALLSLDTTFTKVPILTSGGWEDAAVEDGQHVIRAAGNNKDAAKALTQFLVEVGQAKMTGWTRAALILPKPDPSSMQLHYCKQQMTDIHVELNEWHDHNVDPTDPEDYRPFHLIYEYTADGHIEYEKWLKQAAKRTRVMVLCAARPEEIRGFMLKAEELSMTGGDYMFVIIDYFSSKTESWRKPWFINEDAERNDLARKAYDAAVVLSLEDPAKYEKYRNLTQEVHEISHGRHINYFSACYYDALVLYATALMDVLLQDTKADGFKNSEQLYRRMTVRTISGIAGNFIVDDSGARKATYAIYDMNQTSGEFEEVWLYHSFDGKSSSPGSIHWPGDKQTLLVNTAVPKCGFEGKLCPAATSRKANVAAAVFATLFVLAVIIIIVLVVSRIRSKKSYTHMPLQSDF